MPKLEAFYGLLKETLSAWQRDKASRMAAALAYYTVFSITPLLIIIIAITGLVFGERAARDEIAYLLEDLVGSEAAEMIQTMLANFDNPASGILTSLVGLGTLFYGATGLLQQVQEALNTIWQVQTRAGNGFVHHVKRRFIHLAIVVGVGGFLLLILFAEIVINAITEFLRLESLLRTRNFIIYFVMVTVFFTVLYKILPEVKTAWRDVVIGAVVTSLLFNVGRFLIGVYMRLSTIGSAYGTAGSLVALLVWVYYSAQIFLLGAEFTYVYAHMFGSYAALVTPSTGANVPPEPIIVTDFVKNKALSLSGDAVIQNNDIDINQTPLNLQPHDSIHAAVYHSDQKDDQPKKVFWTKKTLTMVTIIGTFTASILGANWVHQKKKRKEGNQIE